MREADLSVDRGSVDSPKKSASPRSRWPWGFRIGFGLLFTLFLGSLVLPTIFNLDPYNQDLLLRLTPPVWHEGGSWAYPLGIDDLGRDYLARLVYGARISLFIGLCAAAISAVIGTAVGTVAGFYGGRIDTIMMFIITARLSLPVVLVALAVVALSKPSVAVVITVLGLLLWDRFALVARNTIQQVRSADFLVAARTIGCTDLQIFRWELLPVLKANLTVVGTIEIANAIVLESALSFLGLGVPPPTPTWGSMISKGKSFILFDPWLVTIPGTALFLLILAINLIGDALRNSRSSPPSKSG